MDDMNDLKDPDDEEFDLDGYYENDYGEDYPYGYGGSQYGEYDLEDRF